jgi:hypothetical protein
MVQLNTEILSLVVIREINATAVAEIGTALNPEIGQINSNGLQMK